jgi:large subunit ribosomal protein L39e
LARFKPRGRKVRLGAANKRNGNVPVWVVLRTGSKLKRNEKRKNWSERRLKV